MPTPCCPSVPESVVCCCGCPHQALESSLAEAFDVNRAATTISISSTLPSGGDVGDVWAAMELAGSLDKHLQSVASEWGWAGSQAVLSQPSTGDAPLSSVGTLQSPRQCVNLHLNRRCGMSSQQVCADACTCRWCW